MHQEQHRSAAGKNVLPMKRVIERVPYSKTHIYRLISSGKFPKPLRIGENRVGFLESEIDEWLQEKIDAR